MPDGTPFDDNDGLWRFGTWADTEVRTGPKRNRAELAEQRQVHPRAHRSSQVGSLRRAIPRRRHFNLEPLPYEEAA
jgi:hypothetical protein